MNPSDGLWGTLVYGASTGGSLSVGLVFLRLLFGRLDRREAHIDSATKDLIEGLRQEILRLIDRADYTDKKLRECEERDAHRHAELNETREELNHTKAELLKVQRLLQAGGEIRNQIQTGLAAEKRLLGNGKK